MAGGRDRRTLGARNEGTRAAPGAGRAMRQGRQTMRHFIKAIALTAALGASAAAVATEPTLEQTAAEQPAATHLADSEEPRACPTSYEVRSYFWIEPKTGREYKMLNFYCPALEGA